MTHTYRRNPSTKEWEVGHHRQLSQRRADQPTLFEWTVVRSFASEDLAARYVNYLNGGSGGPPWRDAAELT